MFSHDAHIHIHIHVSKNYISCANLLSDREFTSDQSVGRRYCTYLYRITIISETCIRFYTYFRRITSSLNVVSLYPVECRNVRRSMYFKIINSTPFYFLLFILIFVYSEDFWHDSGVR